jgi:hypothetical protein
MVAAPPVGTVVAVPPGGCVAVGASFNCGRHPLRGFFQNNQVVYQLSAGP